MPLKKGKPPLIAIVGPTGVGKTELALCLGEKLPAEVISADSRQVYKYMDIGTAKPSPEECLKVPHHIIDVVYPDQTFTLAMFLEMAKKAWEKILSRGKIPLLVGGTGQYVWAFLEGWEVPKVPPSPELRERLFREAKEKGADALFRRLLELDPEAASFVDPRNIRRVVRALEVCLATGKPFSQLRRRNPPPFRTLILGLTLPRPELYKRVDRRIEAMLEKGLVAEVETLIKMGYSLDLPSMSGVGYKEIGLYLQGELTLEEAVAHMKKRTRNFIRHQYNWFKLSDPRIRWLEAKGEVCAQAFELIQAFLRGEGC
jgi:tRNA dimethylallyltransferase